MHKVLEKIILHKNVKKAAALAALLKENKITVLALFFAVIFTDILFEKSSLDFKIFSALLVYLIFIKIFQIKSTLTFLLCLALLVVMAIDYLLTSASISTEKAAVWLILFLGIGGIQQWKE